MYYNTTYKGSGRGGLSVPPSSVVGNALVVIDDGIESVNVKNRYQGARVSARRANREPEDGIRWLSVPPSSVVGNALVVIDDGIESVNVKNRYQGARVSARRANREPEDGIRRKFEICTCSSSCGQIVRDKRVGVISRG